MSVQPNPVKILQTLLQFDTTNPPGNEHLAVHWVRDYLTAAGIESQLFAKDPDRPNLIARVSGTGNAPPLLLQGHVDVVTTEGQDWQHPPFGAEIHEGFIWGRGTLDMKGGVAMMLTAFLKACAERDTLPGDVILCLLADEEAGSKYGAKFLVEEHPEHFAGIRYALGESGGFNMPMMGKTFYPIMIAEKQICWMEAVLRGPGGHASMLHRDGAMAKLGQILQTLNQISLPVHITPAVKLMVDSLAEGLGFPLQGIVRQLLNPRLTGFMLNSMGSAGKSLAPLFSNTVNATVVSGGSKVNVIPSEIRLKLDGRLLPGFKPDDLIRELEPVLGADTEVTVLLHNPGPPEPDMTLFPLLGEVLLEMAPAGNLLPLVMPGVTDAAYFSKIGIQTYGYLPMLLPEGFDFVQTVHAANERIPVEALAFGSEAIYQVIKRLGKVA